MNFCRTTLVVLSNLIVEKSLGHFKNVTKNVLKNIDSEIIYFSVNSQSLEQRV